MTRIVSIWVALLVSFVATATMAQPPSADARTAVGHARYEVDPSTRSVEFTEEIALPVSGSLDILIPSTATDLTSSEPFERSSRNDLVDLLTVAGRTSSVSIGYSVPGDGEREQGGTRVNDSFIGFHLWPSSTADTVTITLPRGFRTNAEAPGFAEFEVDADRYEYVSERPDDAFGYWFVALRAQGLNIRQVDTGEDLIELAGWAGDEEWLDFTERYVSEGVPVLRQLIGQPWPEENLRVVESAAPTQFGYAGWYDRKGSQIEIPDSVDAETVLHELGHAWFNDRYYQGRWMVEGFAEEYASASLLELDSVVTEPTHPGAAPPGWAGLATWRSRLFFENNWDHEYYGYAASWYVVDALVDEIGSDGMATTIAAMQSGEAPYAQPGQPRLYPPNDWRRFLDMLELRGGSTEAEQIFRDWVVSPTDKLQLDARRDAIADYENFRSEVPLPIPPGIDDSMSRWRFDEVAAKIDDALTTWDEMNATHSRARAIGLTPPTAIEELYGEADADFSRVGQFLDSTDDVLAAFEADPNRPSEDDARNFELGRFEQIEIALERSFVAGELNAGTDGDQGIGLLLLSVFCFVALAVALFVLARMRTDAPASLDEEHTMAAVGKSRTPSL